MTQEKALEILKKYMTKPNLIKHSIAVAACMRQFAKLAGENEEHWAVVGLLHDIDYELYPDSHLEKSVEILKSEGFDDAFIRSVQSHGYEICTDVEPVHYMEKVLCTIDQLSGFLIACALIRPEKKLELVEMPSVHKRWTTPAFAAGTDRERIMRFCERLNKPFDYMAEQTLIALKNIANDLGL
ncbi:MAG: HDIG domain-containing protein [Firmicutes bacterium]|nr:HDIG domain-containing protein [Bacillota bacterium]